MNRRGVSTVMAVVLVGVVGAVLAGVAAFAVAEQRRATIEQADAQVSQLLAAAAVTAERQLAEGKPTDGTIQTPVGEIALAWQGERCTVDVRHRHAGRHAVMTFAGKKLVKLE